jgi:hypothetical protein
MNKKILTIGVVLLAVAILVTPVMAQGPFKNPKAVLETTTQGSPVLDLNLPSEVTNRWFGPNCVHIIVKPADEFYCPTKLDVEDNFMMWLTNADYRGKWVHMNKGTALPPSGYLGLFTIFGLTVPTDIPEEGVYIWGAKT